MNRNKNYDKSNNRRGDYKRKGKYVKTSKSSKPVAFKEQDEELDSKGRDNDPNWYVKNKMIAEQVSQLSMRNFLGNTFALETRDAYNRNVNVPTVAVYTLNPSAGTCFRTNNLRSSAINQATFKLYSRMAAFTGRALTYQPQDVGMMILAMGEVISCVEYVRRAFGVAYTYNQRNRAYPKQVLESMRMDAEDFFSNYALYRNRFNKLITRINQVPIPQSISYFDKCAKLYEKVYLDADSPMAQTYFFAPMSTWILDESSYEGGTILKTTAFYDGQTTSTKLTAYLNIIETQINALLTSSTLNLVYADLMNMFAKLGGKVWLFDYLSDGYQVVPEFNLKMSMQLHNASLIGTPNYPTFNQITLEGDNGYLTPNNDVYPAADKNLIIYSPGWRLNETGAWSQIMYNQVIDFETPNPTVEDRIENTRFMSIAHTAHVETVGQTSTTYYVDVTTPDHYITDVFITLGNGAMKTFRSCFDSQSATDWYSHILFTTFDWAPIQYPLKNLSGSTTEWAVTDNLLGDMNYFTTVDYDYLAPVNEIYFLDLFDMF